jgi:hypothetical protein
MPTDKFESEVQKFIGRQNGDNLTPNIVYSMLEAVDADAAKRSEILNEKLDEHIKEDRTTLVEVHDMLTQMQQKSRAIAKGITDTMEKHLASVEHMTPAQFEHFVKERDLILEVHKAQGKEEHLEFHQKHLDKDHAAEPRLTDPEGSELFMKREMAFPEDEEYGDIRRAWRTMRWFALALALILLDIFGRYLSHILLGYPS